MLNFKKKELILSNHRFYVALEFNPKNNYVTLKHSVALSFSIVGRHYI